MAEHTVITMHGAGPEKGLSRDPPRDYLLLSLFNILLLGNPCCLSFAALVYSVKSRDRKLVGDMDGALTYAKTSKQMNVCAIVLNVLLLIIFLILFFLYVIPVLKNLYQPH
ncbi:interferon-induced transmembrane protein 3-like [Gracilinanus agilis]|uniref:interferon-induced transmembrane protein 3-like n=1 Tax=Gracilinanus agilis TaxID=191870 RepID=UPI001CFCFCF6|nr:interferon-induced transmembrane protein 3-like [Gracilinanus agilis]